MTAFSKNTYTFPLDIKRQTGVKLLGVNGDTANRFIVTLQNAGVNLDLTGLYVRAVFRRSDGVTVLQSESDSPANITKTTGGVVTIDVLNGSFRDGDNEMEIQVLDGDPDAGDVLITSARMLFRVRKELNSDDATESSHEYTVLQHFIEGLGNMTVTVETLAAGSSATAGLIIGDDYSYELALGIPRGSDGADGTDGAGVQSITHSNGVLTFVLTTGRAINVSIPDIVTLSQMGSAIAAAIENSGHYTKPAGGIPKTDLSSGVQDSLALADSALQEHQSLSAYRTAFDQDVIDDAQDAAIAAKYTKPNGGIPATDIANGAVTVTKIADGAVTGAKIAANTVANSNLDYMEPRTIKANNTGSEAAPQDVAFGDLTFFAPVGVGRRGRAGFVPAPTYGDREKFLRGDGTWQAVSNNVFIATFDVTTFAEIAAALDAGKAVGVKCAYTANDSRYGEVNTAWLYSFEPGIAPGEYSTFYFATRTLYPGGEISIEVYEGTGGTTVWETMEYQTDSAPTSNSLNMVTSGGVYTALAGKQASKRTATLTIATSDWQTVQDGATCTKTVTDMTADALVWVEFSDTETEYETTQATNALTFNADAAPSEAVTVKVGWLV